MSRYASRPGEGEHTTYAYGRIDASDLKATIAQVLDRRPCAGLAVAVIADGASRGSTAMGSPMSRRRRLSLRTPSFASHRSPRSSPQSR